MLKIKLKPLESFNPDTNQFEYEEGGTVRFEYSLRILYEWEGKWKKVFLDKNEELTGEEILDFYKMMALDPFDDAFLTPTVMRELSKYISESNTATKFTTYDGMSPKRGTGSGKVYTSEEIYAMMFSAGIPLEFEDRNLNRLLVMLRIISNNNAPPKKMSRSEVLRQNAQLNAQRRAKHKTKG